MKAFLIYWLNQQWYQRSQPSGWLRLLAKGYAYLTKRCRLAYQQPGRQQQLPVPVIVVGNITLGGTGKTPLVAYLVQLLQQQGYKPGILSRGYGAKNITFPHLVKVTDDPHQMADEPLMLARQTGVPVVIDPQRVRAGSYLLAQCDCDLIITDDGLQHYPLARQLEIAVIDGQRGIGNGYTLPAGPLREPKERLKQVDLVVFNGPNTRLADTSGYQMNLVPGPLQGVNQLLAKAKAKPTALPPTPPAKVHAVAGIGNPQRFFRLLTDLGFEVIPHPFTDHYRFRLKDLINLADYPVIMTEKDAIKCTSFSLPQHWFTPVKAQLGKQFDNELLARLKVICAVSDTSYKP
jgi:tetraacyldisaccharide 4'-kinase